MAPIITLGDPIMGYNPSRGFTLPTPRDYRGRAGAAIPTGGIVLPEASNPTTAPVTYAATNLPSGLSFNAGTRVVSGNPTTAHASREVTYTATDSSSPAEVVSRTFAFPVVASTAATSLDDWDSAGYGLSTRNTLLLALLFSGANVGSSDVNIWAVPPRGTTGGVFLPTQLADLAIPGSDAATVITRIRLHPGSDAFTINHSNIDAAGNPAVFSFSNWHAPLIGSRSWWLQWRNDADQYPLSSGDSAGGGFLRVSTSSDSVQANLDNNERFLLAVTDTSP